MNTKNLKAYAPKARSQFIEAVKKRAAHFGIYEDRIEEVRIEGGAAIIEGRAFTRKEGEQRKCLENKVAERGYEMFIREMAYTWFNRLAALRYMEIHDFFDHGFRVLSHPANPDSLPEILSHASDVAESLDLDKSHVIELQLAGDKEEELYRDLLLGQCHHLSKIMPFMFEAIDDATELLLPNNLTKTDSILKGLINDIPEEDWQEIEVIGWLYQFYISEHKDAVIGKVVKSEDIPAATQLFTPNWIVKYLVQNTVGRQWLATYPDSELKGKMEYYIEPAEQSDDVIEQLKAITPTSIDPEEIKVLDPACGSGHILVEVYEILREIYLERGYRLREIPELILTKNIYGLDIDDRAAQLAGFALMMKAREDDRRIFQRVEDGDVSLSVFSMQSTEYLDIQKLWKALDLEGNQQTGSTGGLFDVSDDFVKPTGIYKDYLELLKMLKSTFLQAKSLGSLIQVENQYLKSLISLKELLEEKHHSSDPAASGASSGFLPIVNQAIILAQQYDSVVANPPYMGGKGMIRSVKSFAKKIYPDSKSDLYSMFIEAANCLTKHNGYAALITMQSWMFLSSYEQLRKNIISKFNLCSFVQIGYNTFPSLNSKIAQGAMFVIQNIVQPSYRSRFINLNSAPQSADKNQVFLSDDLRDVYEVEPTKLLAIPSSPIAYWVSDKIRSLYIEEKELNDYGDPRQGFATGDNERFLRYWFEVDYSFIGINASSHEDFCAENYKWAPCNKGGVYRRWYGNRELVVAFDKVNFEALSKQGNNLPSRQYYFQKGWTWSTITSGLCSFRLSPEGTVFETKGSVCFPRDEKVMYQLGGYLNSKLVQTFLNAKSQTLDYHEGPLRTIPFKYIADYDDSIVKKLIELSRSDYDSQELSWDFSEHVICKKKGINNIEDIVNDLVENDKTVVARFKALEEQNNQKLIDSYGLHSEISPEIADHEISLSKNLYFRYGKGTPYKNAQERNQSELASTLLSYAIGVCSGRYSLDRKGLVYAHSTSKDFKQLVIEGAYNTFPADDDGIIPLGSEEWLFDDDATTRFKEFVKTLWGDEHLSENLDFVAESLCLHALKPKNGESAMDTIRRYFSTQFYKDHCKTYKKRPIYWLFSSGKEKAFECLVYLHRYKEGTLSRMRTEYVTPLMGKYDAQHTLLSEQQLQATGTQARRIEKELKSLEKKQAELRTFDEQLKHYAEMRITLDLDDGVKANYGRFGNLLADVKVIHGKAVK